MKIAVRQLPEESAHAEEEVKRLLRDVKKTGEVNIVLDCATERIQSVLKAAQQASSQIIFPMNHKNESILFFVEN